MSEATKIQWCDSTYNPWVGCTKVSPGCANCYAEQSPPAKFSGIKWGGVPRISSHSTFNAPLRWNKKPWVCDECGTPSPEPRCGTAGCYCGSWHRRRVFALSLGDWLDPKVPVEWLARMLDVIRRCDGQDFLLLTKRPELWHERLEATLKLEADPAVCLAGWPSMVMSWLGLEGVIQEPPTNVWFGISCEDQKRADERIPELLKIPAKVRFLSCEPLLGPINLEMATEGFKPLAPDLSRNPPPTQWIIIGGESGKNARPCHVDWIRGIKDQCKAAGVACFVKQFGAKPTEERFEHSENCSSEFCALAGGVDDCDGVVASYTLQLKHPKGGDPEEWPEDLMVQEFPFPTV